MHNHCVKDRCQRSKVVLPVGAAVNGAHFITAEKKKKEKKKDYCWMYKILIFLSAIKISPLYSGCSFVDSESIFNHSYSLSETIWDDAFVLIDLS